MSQATHSPQTRLRTGSQRSAHYHNLPAYSTSLVGRADECQKVGMLLQAKRLVTLLGPGGIGKTSLALAVASDLLSQFEHGVYFVPLSGITSHLFLVSAIAEALHFSFGEARDFNIQLFDYLYDRNILLVLDNYEHLLPNTEFLSALLQSTQAARLLITSRHQLNLQAEWVFELQGLAYPTQESGGIHTNNYAAVELFAQRAQRVRHDFTINPDNQKDVVSTCRLVDGLPLAIELAASWTRALTCQQITEQIQKDLDFLATNWQDLPAKHRSMRGVLTQSWNMLEPFAQTVLRKLAIFQGKFNLIAAKEITGASVQELVYLIDRSLIQFDPAGYYQMHPLMRQYALEMLIEVGEFESISELHCAFYAHFLKQRATEIQGFGQRQALEQIGAAIENIRQGWNWAVQTQKNAQILECLDTLFQFFVLRGYYQDGEIYFAQTVKQLCEQSPATEVSSLISRLVVRQGIFLRQMGRYAEAQAIFQKQLPISEEQNISSEIIICLRELTHITYRQGNYAEAQRLGMDCLAHCKKMGNTAESINVLHILSNIARENAHYDEAYRFLEDALALSDADQFPQLHARSLQNLGKFCNHQGDFEKARACYHDALAIFREMADRPGESLALVQLGVTYTHLSHFSQAIQCYEEAIPILQEIGDQRTLGRAFSNLGVLFQKLGLAAQTRTNLEQALEILHRVGEMRGQCIALSNISHFYFQQGDFIKAQTFAQDFLEAAQSTGDRTALGYAWTNMGNALYGHQNWSAATAAYQRSIEIRRAIGEEQYMLDPLAGLAKTALIQGNLSLALEQVEIILAAENHWKKSEELLQILYICYQVLQAHLDPRARYIITQTHERLQAQAAKIDDAELRHSFLENVPVHQEILSAFTQDHSPEALSKITITSKADPGLTCREREVLRWMAAGHSNQEIADGLCISLSTVKRHITNLHHKLGVKRRTQAVSRAQELGLL